MTRLIQTIIGGLTIAGVYAVIALSMSLIMNVSGVLNLAVAEFGVLGALVTIELFSDRGWNMFLAIVIVLAGAFVVGVIEHEVALRRGRRSRARVAPFIITLGVALVMRGVAQRFWGRDFFGLPSFTGTEPVRLGNVFIPTQALWVIGVALIITVATWALFNYSLWGKVFRSCADNREAAKLMGINTDLVTRLTFGVGGVVGALAGIVIVPLTFMTYQSGLGLLLFAFIAAAMGGLGKTSGAIAGGTLVGLLSALTSGYVSSLFADAIVFAILLIVLVIRPSGLLGSAVDVAQRA